jgi:hypothetical protein
MNSPIRTSTIGLLQYLQLLYLPSELDIDEQIQQVTLYFYCMQYQYHPVIPTKRDGQERWKTGIDCDPTLKMLARSLVPRKSRFAFYMNGGKPLHKLQPCLRLLSPACRNQRVLQVLMKIISISSATIVCSTSQRTMIVCFYYFNWNSFTSPEYCRKITWKNFLDFSTPKGKSVRNMLPGKEFRTPFLTIPASNHSLKKLVTTVLPF